jgi:hypothetical protein
VGIDRQQRDNDPDPGYSRKYGKEQGAEYFFIQFVHSA